MNSGWFLENLWVAAFIPAVGYALILLVGKKLPTKGSGIGIASMAAALVVATGAAIQWIQRVDGVRTPVEGANEQGSGLIQSFIRQVPMVTEGQAKPFVEPVTNTWVWWQNSGFEFGIGSHADGLSILFVWLVAFVSLLVQIFSLEYVRGDRRYTQFFGALTLFSAGMLVMVMADNMVQLILGWEIMGLCSFMLIGHWWEELPNARSALKAFFTVRIGDVGLLVGTAIIYFGVEDWITENPELRELGFNGFNLPAIQAWALSGQASTLVLIMGAVSLFIACIGKSGQFPLHTWLPDAMAGPTPVSSLLHSSTMVVAGVFLVARIYPVFWEAFNIANGGLSFVAVIGAITIIIAALLAFVQDDIKKVLAYSTVSQLGYMMLGLGTGAWLPAVFHVFTHAFFKCCLFLCAGSISHSGSHHSFDMKKDMGGLRKHMPFTFAAWVISTLALTGVIPFSGFWSKDEIIDNVGNNGYTVFMWIGFIGAALTAMYMTRATYLTFFGVPRGAAAGHYGLARGDSNTYTEEGGKREITKDPAGSPIPQALSAAVHAPGADDHHGGPHESPKLIILPIAILAFFAATSGFTNATPLAAGTFGPELGEDVEYQKIYVEPRAVPVSVEGTIPSGPGQSLMLREPGFAKVNALGAAQEGESNKTGCGFEVPEPGMLCYFPAVNHAVPKISKVMLALGIVGGAYAVAIAFCINFYGRQNEKLVGLTERNMLARGSYNFLAKKYYLDHLYENGIARAVAHPISKVTYRFNQHVLDAAVDSVGKGGKRTGQWIYEKVDQGLVDGAVNGSGVLATETGDGVASAQNGKVNLYGALIFAAAAAAATVLVIVN